MYERSRKLERKAMSQLEEIIAFLTTLRDDDLERPDPARPGRTIGTAAAHMAEGYHHLGRLLEAHVFARRSHRPGHAHGRGPERRLSDIMTRAVAARSSVGRLAELADEQLETVPPAGTSRFADGQRNIEQIIEAVIAHQAEHLASLQSAVHAPSPASTGPAE